MRLDIPTFAAAIHALAPAHVAQAAAPGTFAEIMAQAAIRKPLTVWEGASADTIWPDAATNHAFRAWHDACHIAGAYDFTLADETATCKAQQAALRAAYPSAPAWTMALLEGEIIGQANYFAKFGHFPTDQRAFIRGYLEDKS